MMSLRRAIATEIDVTVGAADHPAIVEARRLHARIYIDRGFVDGRSNWLDLDTGLVEDPYVARSIYLSARYRRHGRRCRPTHPTRTVGASRLPSLHVRSRCLRSSAGPVPRGLVALHRWRECGQCGRVRPHGPGLRGHEPSAPRALLDRHRRTAAAHCDESLLRTEVPTDRPGTPVSGRRNALRSSSTFRTTWVGSSVSSVTSSTIGARSSTSGTNRFRLATDRDDGLDGPRCPMPSERSKPTRSRSIVNDAPTRIRS